MRITRYDARRGDKNHRWYSVDDGRRYWLALLVVGRPEGKMYALYQQSEAGPTHILDFSADHWGDAQRKAFKLIRSHKSQIVLDAMKEL